MAKWATALTNGGVWASGFWRVEWQNDAVQVLGIDTTNRVIEITNTTTVPNGIGDKYTRLQGNFAEPFWVMNLLEDMDQPGEWCLDFKRNKIYFYAPTNSLADGSVVISDFAAPLVQLTQTTNVVLRSLVFEDGLAQGILIDTNCQNNLVVGPSRFEKQLSCERLHRKRILLFAPSGRVRSAGGRRRNQNVRAHQSDRGLALWPALDGKQEFAARLWAVHQPVNTEMKAIQAS